MSLQIHWWEMQVQGTTVACAETIKEPVLSPWLCIFGKAHDENLWLMANVGTDLSSCPMHCPEEMLFLPTLVVWKKCPVRITPFPYRWGTMVFYTGKSQWRGLDLALSFPIFWWKKSCIFHCQISHTAGELEWKLILRRTPLSNGSKQRKFRKR